MQITTLLVATPLDNTYLGHEIQHLSALFIICFYTFFEFNNSGLYIFDFSVVYRKKILDCALHAEYERLNGFQMSEFICCGAPNLFCSTFYISTW